MKRILVVEDEAATATLIEITLKDLGYDVTSVEANGRDALRKVEEDKPDLVFMDIKLPGGIDGIDTAIQINRKYNIPIIYLTAYSDQKLVERAKEANPFGYLVKPFQKEELKTTIEISLLRHKLECALNEANDKLKKEISLREKAERELRNYQKNLEGLVKERTAELEEFAGRLKTEVEAHKRANEEIVKMLIDSLSKKETEFLINMAEGLGRKDISKKMDISVATYDIHLRNVKKKLHLVEKSRVIKFAVEYREYL